MSEFIAKKFDIRVDLERKLAEHCAKQRITQKDYINGLIERDLDESVRRALVADEARNQREVTRVGATVETARETAAKLDSTIGRLETDLPNALEKIGASAIEAITKHTGSAEVKACLETESGSAIARDENARAVTAGHFRAAEEVASKRHVELVVAQRETRDLMKITKTRRRLWQLSGATIVIAAELAVASLFPATAPTRWAAIRLMGAANELDAAASMAGLGNRLNGAAIIRTGVLLSNAQFSMGYTNCLTRAERSRQFVTCRLNVPSLKSTNS